MRAIVFSHADLSLDSHKQTVRVHGLKILSKDKSVVFTVFCFSLVNCKKYKK